MSDSDDTDILLLIPPDFFLVGDSEPPSTERYSRPFYTKSNEINSMSRNFALPLGDHQSELDNINARISEIGRHFSAPSDISTISNCTVKSNYSRKRHEEDTDDKRSSSPVKFTHSTPKYSLDNKKGKDYEGSGVLKEIDQYLNAREDPWSATASQHSQYPSRCFNSNSQPNTNVYNSNKQENTALPHCNLNLGERNLLSLQELWGGQEHNGSASLHEERLRRQHCEKTIKALQEKLLEYQQKISVAIQIDRTKDAAIEELKAANQTVNQQVNQLREKLQLAETSRDEIYGSVRKESEELKNRNDNLEKELSQALDLAAKFQSKNEVLEVKVEELNKAYAEGEQIYRKRIEELEVKIANLQHEKSKDAENLDKIKDQLVKAQKDLELAQVQKSHSEKQYELLQGEIELLKQQKHNVFEKYREEKDRVVLLDKQNKNLQEVVSELSEKERKLLKELESQRISLKSHYQRQLEEVVSQKLKEFQTQLDHVEESLKSEAKERECLIAERAIKQIELINDKNEQEIKLLSEKHSEEVELYRIQLLNSTRKIEELEEKVNLYKSRRADIAEKLHNVMETQWRKALEILTSPNSNTTESFQSINPQNLDPNRLDGVSSSQKNKQHPENESFETPTSSRNKKNERSKSRDRLHAYIELLLSKSPKDLENLDEILKPKEYSNQTTKCEKLRQKTDATMKPPWK